MQSDFLPLVVEDQIAGYVHHGFADHLRQFDDVFTFDRDSFNGSCVGKHVGLHPSLKTPEDRTEAVARVVKCLGPELVPVKSSFGGSIIFSLERAAAPYFGIKAYGVHMNGYVEKDSQEYLWIAKRSQVKPTYAGMLDDLVAGGLTNRYRSLGGENLMKDCEEEAGIPRSISCGAIPAGAVSYMDIDVYSYKRDVLFCYDLKLPEGFTPNNQDGEVESFKLIPVPQAANVVRRTKFFKPNCSLVIIDFLLRHGNIKPEHVGYLDLVRSVKCGDCS